jgi:Ni2+-binding GTPase involved in maturation of urease and hydrogenase
LDNGAVSKIASAYATAVRAIIAECDNPPVDVDEVWQFLSVIRVVSYDLATATSQHQSLVQSLLDFTSVGESSPGGASTWSELLQIAGRGMPIAQSFAYDSLPESLRLRHARIGTLTTLALQNLKDHSALTLAQTRTTIGPSATVSRSEVVDAVLEAVATTQVVMIQGPAGSGKSAIAKVVVEALRTDCVCLVFRAEELAVAHFNTALGNAQAGMTARRLQEVLVAHGRTVIVVESVERLLERDVRDGFADLLSFVRSASSFRLVLTCRDYQAETVRTALIEQAALETQVVEIPLLMTPV